ncbi:PKD domain-containing protein [Myxococcota bacterium]|nr:PKD domain-containing protein [Myxococcota bacterium]
MCALMSSPARAQTSAPQGTLGTVRATADTYVHAGDPNTNEGGSAWLRVWAPGNSRVLVRFPIDAVRTLLGDGGTLHRAYLRLDLVDNDRGCGAGCGGPGQPNAQWVNAYRLTSPWAEGDGWVAERPQRQGIRRGTGAGATWACAADVDISDHRTACGTSKWDMTISPRTIDNPWREPATDRQLIHNDRLGLVDWDVTADVTAMLAGSAPDHGWIIRAENEHHGGRLLFASRTGSGREPVLVLDYSARSNAPPHVSAGTSTTVAEGTRLLRTGTIVDGDSTSWTGTVDYGDGTTAALAILPGGTFVLDHTYADDGRYTLTVTVTDDEAASSSVTLTVDVTNVAPAVYAGDDAQVFEAEPFARTVTFTDPGADQWTVHVDYGDGTTDTLTPATRGFELAHVWANAGSYTVALEVCDDELACGTASFVVVAADLEPVAAFSFSPETEDEGRPVSFTNLSVSQPWDPLTYAWSFATFGTSTEEHPTFAFPTQGAHAVCLTVTDDEGTSDTTCREVPIRDLGPVADFDWSPEPADEGSPIAFEDRSTYALDPIVAWRWTFGASAETSVDATPTFTFLEDDAHLVCLEVEDADGSTATACRAVTVVNVAPTADAHGPYEVDEGSIVALVGTASDPGQDLVAYAWDLDGDGQLDDASARDATFTSTASGLYTVSFGAYDDDGAFGSDTATVLVENVAPTARAGGPYAADEGGTITVSAAGSSDPGDDLVAYAWDLDGDGVFNDATTTTATITRADDASFAIAVRVTDADGASSTASADVAFANVAPTVVAGPDERVEAGNWYNGSASITDPGADAFFATIDWGDGSAPDVVTVDATRTFPLHHRFSTAGYFTVQVTVEDDDGGRGTTSFVVTVDAAEPQVFLGEDVALAEGSALVTSGMFFDPTRSSFTVLVDWGDGSAIEPIAFAADHSFTLAHTYVDEGAYAVTVLVANEHGRTGADGFTVFVHNVAPTVAIGVPDAIDEGQHLLGAGSFADPGADTWTVRVTWGDGTSETLVPAADRSFTLDHEYLREGTYTVALTVDDGDGGVGSASAVIEVRNRAPVVTVHDRGRFPLGTTELTFTAMGLDGTASTCGTSVTVVDTTAPAVTCPASTVLVADQRCQGSGDPRATASDVCNPSPSVSRSPAGSSWPLGTTTVRHTADDGHGNTSSCESTVVVVDHTPAVIACNARNVRADETASFTATADDACGATAAITSHDCWAPSPTGGRVSKLSRCVVTYAGATVTISAAGDPGDTIEWRTVATDVGGNVTETTCSLVVQAPLVSPVGCADGQREGYLSLTQYPNIAACSGGWSVPGIHASNPGTAPSCGVATFDTVNPACNRGAGDDGTNPNGAGCNVADLCGVGWHVCNTGNDVLARSPTGCVGSTVSGDSMFWATRQSTTGCGVCANGASTGPQCNSGSCVGGCLQTAAISNDVFGCGTIGAGGFACGPLDRFSHDGCSALGAPWTCSDGGGYCEAYRLRKTDASRGGVLCCRD